MPGMTIHLAAVNCYLKMHPAEDKDEFIRGAIAPDLAEDTDVSHHSSPSIRNNALSFLLGKVILKDCLDDFDINTTYHEIKDRLYHDYTATSSVLKAKYNVVFPSKVKDWDISSDEMPTLINYEDVCRMIDWLGGLDLNAYLKNMV